MTSNKSEPTAGVSEIGDPVSDMFDKLFPDAR